MIQSEQNNDRVEKKLDEIQNSLKILSDKVLTLTVINENYKIQSMENKADIERLVGESNTAKGALSALRWIVGGLSAFLLVVSGWVLSTASSVIAENNIQNTAIEINKSKLSRIESDVEVNKNRISDIEKLFTQQISH